MNENLSLTAVPQHLRKRGVSISYNRLWRAAIEGRIPAEQNGGRWFVKSSDLPAVAEALSPVQP